MSKFKCDDCDKEFKSKRNLVHHATITCKYNEKIQKVKNPKFKHGCGYCEKRFRTQNLAKRHTKRLHSTNVSSSPAVAFNAIETQKKPSSNSVRSKSSSKLRIISDENLPLCTLQRIVTTPASSMLQVETCSELKIDPCRDCQQTENHNPCRFQYFRKIRCVKDRTI